MPFLTWDWKDLVGLIIEVWKLIFCMNSSILDSYCVVGKITSEFSLSARVIIATLSLSFVLMLLMALESECVLCVCVCVCVCVRVCYSFFKVLIRSAVSFLYTSRSKGGRCDMAVSATRARFWIQFLCFLFMLYLGPFCSTTISGSEIDMSVMFTTLWWNVCFVGRGVVCCWVRRLGLLSTVWYLNLQYFWRILSISCCVCGHRFVQDFANFRFNW